MCVRERETDRQRDRDRQTESDRETETDRQTETETERMMTRGGFQVQSNTTYALRSTTMKPMSPPANHHLLI